MTELTKHYITKITANIVYFGVLFGMVTLNIIQMGLIATLQFYGVLLGIVAFIGVMIWAIDNMNNKAPSPPTPEKE